MTTYEPVVRDVLWTHPSTGQRTTPVDLAHARSKGLDDDFAIRRIVAIAELGNLYEADNIVVLTVTARKSAHEENK